MEDFEVRILELPPCTVASSRAVGPAPEGPAAEQLIAFIQGSGLAEKMPGARVFGFNSPDPAPGRTEYGYEFWVTIPKELDVPAPLTKKQFPGGLYAAHRIPMGHFDQWGRLFRWVKESSRYTSNGSGSEKNMGGCLEEHLNFVTDAAVRPENCAGDDTFLDLLEPVARI